MRSGDLRYPAEFVREVKERTDTGAETTVYKVYLKVRVGYKTVSGREFIDGGAETMETTIKVVMRKVEQQRVLVGDMVRADAKEFKVLGVLEFDKGRSLQLMCKEII